MVHDGKPYCQEDYMKMCGKKCSGCGEYISGEYINALNQEWHKNCFNCFVSEKENEREREREKTYICINGMIFRIVRDHLQMAHF